MCEVNDGGSGRVLPEGVDSLLARLLVPQPQDRLLDLGGKHSCLWRACVEVSTHPSATARSSGESSADTSGLAGQFDVIVADFFSAPSSAGAAAGAPVNVCCFTRIASLLKILAPASSGRSGGVMGVIMPFANLACAEGRPLRREWIEANLLEAVIRLPASSSRQAAVIVLFRHGKSTTEVLVIDGAQLLESGTHGVSGHADDSLVRLYRLGRMPLPVALSSPVCYADSFAADEGGGALSRVGLRRIRGEDYRLDRLFGCG